MTGPSDEVVQLSADLLGVEYGGDFVFDAAVDFDWRRRGLTSVRDGVRMVRAK